MSKVAQIQAALDQMEEIYHKLRALAVSADTLEQLDDACEAVEFELRDMVDSR